MRFLIDAQLPPAFAPFLEAEGYHSRAVRDVDLRDASDSLIWDYAIREGFVVVTKDEDFPARALNQSTAPQILWLRIGN